MPAPPGKRSIPGHCDVARSFNQSRANDGRSRVSHTRHAVSETVTLSQKKAILVGSLDLRATLAIVRQVLAADFACDEACFTREGTFVVPWEERAGRRRFPARDARLSLMLAT